MKLQAITISNWIYPDSPLTEAPRRFPLHAVRGGDACCYLLTDLTVPAGTPCSWQADFPAGVQLSVQELRPVYVPMNSDPTLFATPNYELCKDYVVRKAPYTVFERIRPMEDGCLEGGRVAFFLCAEVAADVAAGPCTGTVTVSVGGECADITLDLTIHKTVLLPAQKSPFEMSSMIYVRNLLQIHKLEVNTEDYFRWYRTYMRLQVDMRCTHFGVNTAVPIRDDAGKVVGFDFSESERCGRMALEEGFRCLRGGYVARWQNWDGAHNFLNWDREVSTDSMEGFRQLKLYFKGVREMVERNGWQQYYVQSLVDEPQFPNSLSYRALCAIFRKEVPGIPILDPVEAYDLYGGCDIWSVKQATFDQYKEQFVQLAEMGEKFWTYACSYPAGKWMNRIIDLPMSATRLFTWMAVRYGITGYSHWGFSAIDPDYMHPLWDTCRPRAHKGTPRLFPPGGHSLVYMAEDRVYTSVRYYVTRKAAADAELLIRLKERDREGCYAIIDSVCTSFQEYTMDPVALDQVELALLNRLDALDI